MRVVAFFKRVGGLNGLFLQGYAIRTSRIELSFKVFFGELSGGERGLNELDALVVGGLRVVQLVVPTAPATINDSPLKLSPFLHICLVNIRVGRDWRKDHCGYEHLPCILGNCEKPVSKRGDFHMMAEA